MRKIPLATAACFAVTLPLAAHAAPLMSLGPSAASEGLTYTLVENSISANGLTASFTFSVTGYNTAADLEGGTSAGRASVEAFAFNQPSPGTVTTGSVSAPPGYTFVLGGLNSSGCNMTGNFFCFNDTSAPSSPALSPGTLTFNFSVTADTAGVWSGYTTAMKINWLGTANNYNLISQPIPVNVGPSTEVPEPGSLAILGSSLLGLGIAFGFKNRLGRRPNH